MSRHPLILKVVGQCRIVQLFIQWLPTVGGISQHIEVLHLLELCSRIKY